MPPPIFCLGQSWGGTPVLITALLHPRLFAGIVALEPFLATGGEHTHELGFAGLTAKMMARRRDRWPSRMAARTAMLQNPYFAAFDKDVFEKVVEHDLKPTGNGDEVTLVTPKAMEVVTMMRLMKGESNKTWTDWSGAADQQIGPGFYRAEPSDIALRLQDVRPPTLYVWATNSPVGRQDYIDLLVNNTGSGRLGSGGKRKGCVELVWVKDSGHPMPLEKPKETAEAMIPWIQKMARRWVSERESEKGEFHVTKLNPVWIKSLEKL